MGNFDPPVAAGGIVQGNQQTHPQNAMDVNSDGEASALDALMLIENDHRKGTKT